ncbi:hypothetical protein O988_02861 [Pseudogymnoascus sp. VKM F-3808]|nr:hypothetical protein O988_02861 [Pseudogymnoascus sp. VKM F-3808]
MLQGIIGVNVSRATASAMVVGTESRGSESGAWEPRDNLDLASSQATGNGAENVGLTNDGDMPRDLTPITSPRPAQTSPTHGPVHTKTKVLLVIMSPLQVIPGSPRFKREWTRPICRKLRSLHQPSWGFTIFRTVCTPQSDVQFPLFLAKLDAYVKDSIDYELRPDYLSGPSTEPPFDSGPNEEMKRRYANDVIEDPSLDGASIDEVRDVFTKWLKDNGVDLEMHQLYARHRVCIMVDEAVLNSVAAGPEDPDQSYGLESVWVKVVEYLAPGEQEWQGWLEVGLNALYYFWFNVFAGEEVESMFEATMDQGEDVFTG